MSVTLKCHNTPPQFRIFPLMLEKFFFLNIFVCFFFFSNQVEASLSNYQCTEISFISVVVYFTVKLTILTCHALFTPCENTYTEEDTHTWIKLITHHKQAKRHTNTGHFTEKCRQILNEKKLNNLIKAYILRHMRIHRLPQNDLEL